MHALCVRQAARKPLEEAQEHHRARCCVLFMDLKKMVTHSDWWEKPGSHLPPDPSEARLVSEPWIWG